MNPIHILATSRKEVGINKSLVDISPSHGSFLRVGIEGAHVQHDIEKFLRHRLEDGKFVKWKEDLKFNIEKRLASQADRM
jgi:hypothetical protein